MNAVTTINPARPSPSGTPTDVPIKPRHPAFDLERALATDWHSNDPFKTAFFNALSLTFPVGEKYFIDSIRSFQKQIVDPQLSAEIRGFIGQEAIHRREHIRYNEILCAARNADGAAFEARLQARVDSRAGASPWLRLMETVAFEHLTAILAYALLTDENCLEGADPTLAGMWRWHAIEEAEHKAVTFDVYRAAGGDMSLLHHALAPVTKQFLIDLLEGTWILLKASGKHRNPLVWARGLAWLFGPKGFLRRLLPLWKSFRTANFHPWDHDTRDLISAWKQTDEPVLMAA